MLLTEHNGSGLSRGTEKGHDIAEIFDRLRGKPRFLKSSRYLYYHILSACSLCLSMGFRTAALLQPAPQRLV